MSKPMNNQYDETKLPEWIRSATIDEIEIGDTSVCAARKFLLSLKQHIFYVVDAGRMLGISEKQLLLHDQSKFSSAEFPSYAKHFHGGGDPDGFARAWLHHMNFNPHHWQYWIFPDGFTPKGSKVENGIVEMPDFYALEMIADWMGASMAYTGTWDMNDWLYDHVPKIKLHSHTANYVSSALGTLGYSDIVQPSAWGRK